MSTPKTPKHQAEPTQVVFPAKTVIRTLFQAALGLFTLLPVIVGEVNGAESIPWVAAALVVTGSVTRIMANPAVNDWLYAYIPWLAPADKRED